MSTKITVTGGIAEPELRFTQGGKAVLELRIAGTFSRRNKDTQQWEDQGAPLWHSATFWEKDAEKLAELLHKGDRVSVEGIQVLDQYTARDGSQQQKHVIANPRFLGFIPRAGAPNTPAYDPTPSAPMGGPQNGTYDVWGNGGANDEPAPF